MSWGIIVNVEGNIYQFGHEILQDFLCARYAANRGMKPKQVMAETSALKSKSILSWMERIYSARGSSQLVAFLEGDHKTHTSFVYKARWFVLSQTDGEELGPTTIPDWDAEQALASLSIERMTFDIADGNCQGYARDRRIAINPVAQLPHKTLFHEMAHVILHTAEGNFTDTDQMPRNLREVEAESVALLCCESLGLEGSEYCRGYIQNWRFRGIGLDANAIPEKSAQKIFRAADQIIRAGRPSREVESEH